MRIFKLQMSVYDPTKEHNKTKKDILKRPDDVRRVRYEIINMWMTSCESRSPTGRRWVPLYLSSLYGPTVLKKMYELSCSSGNVIWKQFSCTYCEYGLYQSTVSLVMFFGRVVESGDKKSPLMHHRLCDVCPPWAGSSGNTFGEVNFYIFTGVGRFYWWPVLQNVERWFHTSSRTVMNDGKLFQFIHTYWPNVCHWASKWLMACPLLGRWDAGAKWWRLPRLSTVKNVITG